MSNPVQCPYYPTRAKSMGTWRTGVQRQTGFLSAEGHISAIACCHQRLYCFEQLVDQIKNYMCSDTHVDLSWQEIEFPFFNF